MTALKKSALVFLALILTARADIPKERLQSGILLLKQNKTQEAVSHFRQLTAAYPSEADGYYYLGLAAQRLGDTDEALTDYKKAIELKPNAPDYHYSLATLLLTMGEDENALKELGETVRLAPQSYTGKIAAKEKTRLERSLKEQGIQAEWARKQKEEDDRKKAEKEAAQQQGQQTGMQVPGEGPASEQPVEKKERDPIEKVVKRTKRGTDSGRKQASSELATAYTAAELKPYVEKIIQYLTEEKNIEVKKNLVWTIAKSATPEATDALLRLLDNPVESFDLKLTTLDALGGTQDEKVTTALRTTLSNLVARRVQARADAKNNIDSINKQLEAIDSERVPIETDVQTAEQKKNEITMKLDSARMEIPGEGFPGEGGPPRGGPASGQLKPAEKKKLQDQAKKLEADLKVKKEKLEALDKKRKDLDDNKTRYEALLAEKGTGTQMSEEDKNEQTFALALITTLGRLKDRTALAAVKKGWQEYGVPDSEISYFLALAQMGDYSRISDLKSRLQVDYPDQEEARKGELTFRCAIIESLGEYVKASPEQDTTELLQFLAEDAPYEEIKTAASDALSTKKPGEQAKKPDAKKPVPAETKKTATPAQPGRPPMPMEPGRPPMPPAPRKP